MSQKKREEQVAAAFQYVGAARALRGVLNGALIGREEEAEAIVIAAIAGEHVVMIGPPGTAKSAMSRTLCAATGARGFEYLLTKFSVPEELFGPFRITELKADRFVRATTDRLPEAEVAFLDEIFKANSSILNALLTALNERVFHNGGTPHPIPLRMVVAASNEYPKADVSALWDRFMVRLHVDYLPGHDKLLTLLMAAEQRAFGAPRAVLDVNTWDAMRAEAARVVVPPKVLGDLVTLKLELQSKGHVVSDRRLVRSLDLLRAAAYLDGRTEVVPKDMRVLRHAWWSTERNRAEIQAAISIAAAPNLAEAQEIYDALMQGIEQMTQFQALAELKRTSERIQPLVGDPVDHEVQRLYRKVMKRYDDLLEQARNERTR